MRNTGDDRQRVCGCWTANKDDTLSHVASDHVDFLVAVVIHELNVRDSRRAGQIRHRQAALLEAEG